MRGVDISNWQAGISPVDLGIDFCICKATEGLNFIDAYCDGWIEQCKKAKIKWGFYHFARTNDPVKEARFFYKHCKGYIGNGIPVLDYEVTNTDNVKWCERFIDEFHRLSGVWCIIYLSASRCAEYENSWIPEKCGLWVAGYPQAYTYWTDDDMPYNIYPFDYAAIWQFTSSLNLNGWSLDGNVAYMDKQAWSKYAKSETVQNAPAKQDATPSKPLSEKSCEELAREVIAGKWDNGWNRQQALDNAYGEGTYQHVQCIVDNMLGLDGC